MISRHRLSLTGTVLAGLVLSACSSKLKLTDTDYRVQYGSTQADLRFTSGSVTRTAPGFREINAARIRRLGDQRYFVQWTQEDGDFVTMLFDLGTLQVFTSVLPGGTEARPLFQAGTLYPR